MANSAAEKTRKDRYVTTFQTATTLAGDARSAPPLRVALRRLGNDRHYRTDAVAGNVAASA
jgi:hypothetical protein